MIHKLKLVYNPSWVIKPAFDSSFHWQSEAAWSIGTLLEGILGHRPGTSYLSLVIFLCNITLFYLGAIQAHVNLFASRIKPWGVRRNYKIKKFRFKGSPDELFKVCRSSAVVLFRAFPEKRKENTHMWTYWDLNFTISNHWFSYHHGSQCVARWHVAEYSNLIARRRSWFHFSMRFWFFFRLL